MLRDLAPLSDVLGREFPSIKSLMAKVFEEAMQANKSYIENGKLIESDIADHQVRIKSSESVAKILGDLNTAPKTTNIDARKVNNFNESPEARAEILQIAKDMKEVQANMARKPNDSNDLGRT